MSEFTNAHDHSSDIKRSDFPDDFIFGVGSSAYQVEGGWRADGKGLSIWDCFSSRYPDKIQGGTNGCHSVENYSRMKEDVQLLKKLGVTSYRFSISWSRILPGGKLCMGKSMEGIDHYNKLIDELLANDIEPFVTLFHFDFPNALEEEYMGFLSSKIVDDFVNYVDICFWEFGDRVKNWVTLNEPYTFTYLGYVTGAFAPGRGGKNQDGDPQVEPYIVAYNLLNCHAAAYRKYQEDYKSSQKGRVGITLNCSYFQPYRGSSHQPDIQAVDYAYDFMFGWFLDPLTKGTWPENMQKFAITPTSDYPNGRVLPKFSIEQHGNLICSYDFLAINYYNAEVAKYQEPADEIPPGYATDCHYASSGFPDKNEPGKTLEEVRDDTFRVNYIKKHLNAIKIARHNNVNVTGYFVWSFLDSFEWGSGYNLRFGMMYVDYTKDLQRYPKKSAVWYRKFLCGDKKVNDASNKTEQAIEVNQKLKKSKA